MNFNHLGLKKIICTSYSGSPIAGEEFSDLPLFRSLNSKKAYKVEITEVCDENGDGAVDLSDVELLIKNRKNKMKLLKGDGDFRSQECIELLKESDVIVTNPPFSLFREYVAQLIKYNKKFLIIGNINTVTYKEIFPLIKNNEIWLGQSIHSGDREFRVPNSYPLNAASSRVDNAGVRYIRVKGVRWYTNIDFKERHEDLILYKKYTPEEYPKYDNYDAINVDKTSDIPCDYDGAMGVPITFLDKYNPDQFKILALGNSRDNFTPNKNYINPKKHLKNGEVVSGGAINCVLAINEKDKPTGKIYYTARNANYLVPPYARILIKRKSVTEKRKQ